MLLLVLLVLLLLLRLVLRLLLRLVLLLVVVLLFVLFVLLLVLLVLLLGLRGLLARESVALGQSIFEVAQDSGRALTQNGHSNGLLGVTVELKGVQSLHQPKLWRDLPKVVVG